MGTGKPSAENLDRGGGSEARAKCEKVKSTGHRTNASLTLLWLLTLGAKLHQKSSKSLNNLHNQFSISNELNTRAFGPLVEHAQLLRICKLHKVKTTACCVVINHLNDSSHGDDMLAIYL